MSRQLLPKQFLRLASDRTMLQETVLRLSGLPDIKPLIAVCNNEHRFLIAEQLRDLGCGAGAIILEHEGRNTAPAIAAAALSAIAQDEQALLLVLPADHLIADLERFRAAMLSGAALAEQGWLVTFGVKPTRPATGYGYIERGRQLEGGAYRVTRFVEKPDPEKAREFLGGRHYWNSGMFAFSARRYLDELMRYRPDIVAAVSDAWEQSKRDLDFVRLDPAAFARCPADSVDYAVMEKSDRVAVVPMDAGWSDIGSWSELWEVGAKDAAGNVVRGDVHLDGVRNSYVRAEHRMVSVIGIDDAVIVETSDAVLVAARERAQEVKDLVHRLRQSQRNECMTHTTVYRPWGYYECIGEGDRYQIKRIMVKPGAALSLQMHHHRAEHWVVVQGTAKVTCDNRVSLISENQSTYIPIGSKHRLENPGKVPLYLVEVQSGCYLGEDDIVRLDDPYGR